MALQGGVASRPAAVHPRLVEAPPAHPTWVDLDPVPADRSLAYDGWTVLLCGHDGGFRDGGDGLYDLDARILSRHEIRLDGVAPIPIGRPRADGPAWSASLYLPRRGGTPRGPRLPQDDWSVRLERDLGPAMRERIRVTNDSMTTASTELTLVLDADFADALGRGTGGPEPAAATRDVDGGGSVTWRATFEHVGRDGVRRRDERGLRVRVASGPEPRIGPAEGERPAAAGGAAGPAKLRWAIEVPPRSTWSIELTFASLGADGTWREPGSDPGRAHRRTRWVASRARVETPDGFVGRAVSQAATDLLGLRNWELEPSPDGSAWVPNAGLPWFTGLFGRDALTAGWQAALLGPELMRGALEAVAGFQGRVDDPWREEQPGRMIHEHRRGPLARIEARPHGRYYGSQTSGSMFVLALSEAWHWTGDLELLRRHRDAAVDAVAWAETFGDPDGDGFLESVKRSPDGLRNQAWKDSDEAIRWPDGRIVANPLATVEEQAFHYLALLRLAEVLVALDERPDEVERLLQRASDLAAAWDRAFWLPDVGFYALALDPEKRPVASISSNPIHALGVGIIPPHKAPQVADRLLAPDLFSGWGIRTLSADHPAFNPFGYHLGTVWPVENATAAIGFKRYGLEDHLDALLAGMFGAVAHGRALRLPEAISGLDRDDVPYPVAYPRGCSPQAWSASAIVQLVQTMLGLYPFAPASILALVRPRLPEWLPSLTIRGLRVGDATVSLRFERGADGRAAVHILERSGTLHLVHAPPPDTDDLGPLEGVLRFGLEHAPGRLGRALRIGLGLPSEVKP